MSCGHHCQHHQHQNIVCGQSFVPSYGIRHLVLYYDSNDNYVKDDGDHDLDDHTGYDDDLDGDDDDTADLVNAQL